MKVIQYVLIAVYVLLLHVSYVSFISPNFSYLGYRIVEIDGVSLALTIVLIFIPLLYAKVAVTEPSGIFFWIIYIIVYIPVLLIPNYLYGSVPKTSWMTDIIILLCITMLYSIASWPILQIPAIYIKKSVARWMYIIITSGLFIYIISVAGIHLKPPVDSEDIYSTRLGFRQNTSPIVGYGMQWLAKIFDPILVIFGLLNRKVWFVLLGFFLQYLLFTTNGLKSTLMSTALLIMVFIALRMKGKYFSVLFVGGISLLLAVSVGWDYMTSTYEMTSLLARRMIFTPGLLMNYYVEFFSTHAQTKLSYSLLAGFFDNPYSVTPPFIIGDVYFNRPDMAANANLFADAFANFGYIGVLVYTSIAAIILWLYNSLAIGSHKSFAMLLLVMPVWSLADTSLTTVFLTHGLLLALIIVYILKCIGAMEESNFV
ncbi:hypothetical protein [Listeria booriae]|uniref:hypothetical protein n=1 Tax=Listeria booriae TaxID=1552123 RepID=UPI001625E2CF|nr:hypothetical protein [Listeria booriae]MBC2324173.1 hypothetical protein [Listeria booriae]MBC2327818.1 hypothetical protein [Listeria booriae]MCD2208034.1 hypothetical protein [Listeria booriae]